MGVRWKRSILFLGLPFISLVIIAYLDSDGHALSPRWRRWMICGLAGVVAFLIGSAGDVAGFRETHDRRDPPLPSLPQPVSAVVAGRGVGPHFSAVLRCRVRSVPGDAGHRGDLGDHAVRVASVDRVAAQRSQDERALGALPAAGLEYAKHRHGDRHRGGLVALADQA
jgi:hypothetical protein